MNTQIKEALTTAAVKIIVAATQVTTWVGVGAICFGAYLYQQGKVDAAIGCFTFGGGLIGVNNSVGKKKDE